MADVTTRPLRYCDICGSLDDHPRHVRSLGRDEPDFKPSQEFLDALPEGPTSGHTITALSWLLNPRIRTAHMDCCAAAGCTTCTVTEVENDGKRGQKLIDHLNTTREVTNG